MSKPIIGIVGRCEQDDRGKFHISTREEYRQALIKMNANPICILPPQDVTYYSTRISQTPPLTEAEKEMLQAQIKLCDGIILPGGFKTSEYDRYIISYCTEHDIPILGICMGMQEMANLGRTDEEGRPYFLVERNNEDGINHCEDDKKYVHKVKIRKDSKLYNILKEEEFMVNSFHNFHITESLDYDIVGYSEDGLIEAIEHKENKFNIGVQWHPERLVDDKIQERLLKAFIKSVGGKENE